MRNVPPGIQVMPKCSEASDAHVVSPGSSPTCDFIFFSVGSYRVLTQFSAWVIGLPVPSPINRNLPLPARETAGRFYLELLPGESVRRVSGLRLTPLPIHPRYVLDCAS